MADQRICSIADCSKKHLANGYCSAHYQRLYKSGRLNAVKTPAGEQERFIEAASRSSTDECIMWPFKLRSKGHGQFSTKGGRGVAKSIGAHREVCIRTHGTPTSDRPHALHSCNNAGCVNPRHLRWGTNDENIADKVAAGNQPRGETISWSRLCEADVRDILASPTLSHGELARRHGVSIGAIRGIRSGANWAHISRPHSAA